MIEGLLFIIFIFVVFYILYKLFSGNGRDNRYLSKEEKEEILRRQDYTCATCDDEDWRLFEFHHKKKYAEGGRTNTKNVIAICSKCHTKLTRNYK